MIFLWDNGIKTGGIGLTFWKAHHNQQRHVPEPGTTTARNGGYHDDHRPDHQHNGRVPVPHEVNIPYVVVHVLFETDPDTYCEEDRPEDLGGYPETYSEEDRPEDLGGNPDTYCEDDRPEDLGEYPDTYSEEDGPGYLREYCDLLD